MRLNDNNWSKHVGKAVVDCLVSKGLVAPEDTEKAECVISEEVHFLLLTNDRPQAVADPSPEPETPAPPTISVQQEETRIAPSVGLIAVAALFVVFGICDINAGLRGNGRELYKMWGGGVHMESWQVVAMGGLAILMAICGLWLAIKRLPRKDN